MASATLALMDSDPDIGAGMAVATVAVPGKVTVIMAAVDFRFAVMTVQTANCATDHNDIVHRGVRGLDIRVAG